MKYLTLFTAPKPFTNPHIDVIQRNALRSWLELGNQVEIVLIGNEVGMDSVAREYGIRHFPEVKTNSSGTPLLDSIFELALSLNNSPFLAYINADIIILPDMIEIIRAIAKSKEKFLVVGQRWDLDVKNLLSFENGWELALKSELDKHGSLHPKAGSDYFIYPRSCFESIPAFAVGRAGWDNWMIYHARREHWPVIDATRSIQIIHQNHDYSHLPEGKPHYRLPETDENVRLAGGKQTVFTLDDANFMFDERVKRSKCTWKHFWREVEIFPLVTLHSKFFSAISNMIFHPRGAYANLRKRFTNNQRSMDR